MKGRKGCPGLKPQETPMAVEKMVLLVVNYFSLSYLAPASWFNPLLLMSYAADWVCKVSQPLLEVHHCLQCLC